MVRSPGDSLADHPLQTQVYQRLLKAIISLDLLPEERLVESTLAAQLGVSRLPVREALRQLEREQLVVISHRRGARVAPLTGRGAAEIYTLRISLESLAAGLAAENAGGGQVRAMEATLEAAAQAIALDDRGEIAAQSARFHAAVVAASDNRMLAIVLQTIGHHVARLRTIQALSAQTSTAENALQGHRAIYQAIAKRQARRAERLMAEHIRIALDRIVPLLSASSLDRLTQLAARSGPDGTESGVRLPPGDG